jgi:hypothetical protein
LDQPQDVVEDWAVDWSQTGREHKPSHQAGTGLGLSVDWYRDVLRAKLVSLRLPRRLLVEYKTRFIADYKRIMARWKPLKRKRKARPRQRPDGL